MKQSLILLACGLSLSVASCLSDSESQTDSEATGPTGAKPGYYDSVDTSDAEALRQTLHAVIEDHQRFPYTSSRTDAWDILERADQDPNAPDRVLDRYRNESYPKAGGGNANYHREHVWPKSYGFPRDFSGNYPYTDCHHLFIANGEYNSARSNKPFDDCDASCIEFTTEDNGGRGGGGGVYPGFSNWTFGNLFSGTWEVWSERKGDVARALFYMDVRYEGGTHGATGHTEPDLILTDDLELLSAVRSNQDEGFMGRLSTLLAWHRADPVTPEEILRNDIIESFQGNRNPFVDHPEWVECVFADTCGAASGAVWINELHYDNAGGDTDEGVEIAGRAGVSLDGFTVVGYNGTGGEPYKTIELSGAIPDQGRGGGAAWFAFDGMQNGSPDALALVDGDGQVVQFLSYEGSLTATSGPAAGMTALDIAIEETGETPVGDSLHLVGAGCGYEAFTWASGPQSQGAANGDQDLLCE